MLFDKEFEVFLADTEKSKDIHYQLRYRVYCKETGFEDPNMFQSGRELDEYDDNAVHFIVRARATGEWVAALRLIINNDLQVLPVSSLMPQGSFQRRVIEKELTKSRTDRVLEISRLCVVDSFRKGGGASSKREPEIMLGLLRTVYAFALENQIDCGFFTVTKSLARILRSLNMRFLDAGPECDYHGLRSPYYVHVSTFLKDVPQKSQAVYQMFHEANPYSLYSAKERQKLMRDKPVQYLLPRVILP